MKKIILFSMLSFLFFLKTFPMSDISRVPRRFEEISKIDFEEVSKLNSYVSLKRTLKNTKDFKKLKPLVEKLLDFSISDKKERLKNNNLWFNEQFSPFLDLDLFDFDDFFEDLKFNAHSYIRKDNISDDGQKVIVIGDLHGNFDAFNYILKRLIKLEILNKELKLNDNYKLVFLGDFIDRGKYSLNIAITLMFLGLFNSENVVLLRGNHEDKDVFNDYGFTEEFRKKLDLDFDSSINFTDKLNEFFKLLSAAYFIKNKDDIFMFNHAGTLNLREDNPEFKIFEEDINNIKDFLSSNKTYLGITERTTIQLLWNDIDFSEELKESISARGGNHMYKIPLNLAFDWMKDLNIKYKFMGHMHNVPKGDIKDILTPVR